LKEIGGRMRVCRRAREPGHVQLHKDQGKRKGPQHFTNGKRFVWKWSDSFTWDLISNVQYRRRMTDGAWNKKNDKN
jgi:hypothetical protein